MLPLCTVCPCVHVLCFASQRRRAIEPFFSQITGPLLFVLFSAVGKAPHSALKVLVLVPCHVKAAEKEEEEEFSKCCLHLHNGDTLQKLQRNKEEK